MEFRFTEEAKENMEGMWIEGFESLKNRMKIECEFYAKLIAIIIFHGIANCVEVNDEKELSLVKAMITFKKRAREMVGIIKFNSKEIIQQFIENLVSIWKKFAIKDSYRKKRMSTLQMLGLSTLHP